MADRRPEGRRAAGVLLHPTSLPGRFGVGDLGSEAVRFLDWAAAAGCTVWQILPLGPPNCGAPYSAFSTAAGNPLLISPELLRDEGLLTDAELDEEGAVEGGRVDFAQAEAAKDGLLRRAFARFRSTAELDAFVAEESSWLADWTLFAALKSARGGEGWWQWPEPLRSRDAGALAAARAELRDEIAFQSFVQLQFRRQWEALREAAHERGIRIFGDVPIYVAYDSVEVWRRPDLFELDQDGRPIAVAGCPPDDYSEDGQLWGNPLYRWPRIAQEGYRFWALRLGETLRLIDLVRLDHFRGFAGYWRVPAEEETARGGRWVPGPGKDLFDALRGALGELPAVAEDLGEITDDVKELLAVLGFPGIRVLQFGFDDAESPYAAHHLVPRSVVYTGTHDNDTTAGWFESLDEDLKDRVLDYCGTTPEEVHWGLVRLALTSVSELAVVPVQDLLGLGGEARMNMPSTTTGNWSWRLRGGELDAALAGRFRRLVELTGRLEVETAGPAEEESETKA